ncbi:MAG: hypothetical protein CVU46_01205 [Chloroflexi bacterium HGW-Chloroflexi-8]|nr:MAG: hypothetical protein CVU46_01205 [Chloroflexi bacterium HGW-Chloroflexi-8]
MELRELRIVHVNDVASVGANLVSGLCDIGVNAKLYRLLNYKNEKFPKILQYVISTILRVIEIFRFKQYIKNEKINLIHIHYGTHAYLPLFFGFPFFLHIHGTDVRIHIHWPILGKIIRSGIEKAESVFYTTPDLKPLVEKIRPDAIFFPNPIDTEQFIPRTDFEFQDTPVLFNINKIDRFKGIGEVLKSIELVWNEYPKIKVKMFNYGNAMEEVKEFLNKYEGDSRLVLLSRTPHKKMISTIQDSTFILGQIGTGILTVSELEGMACGKPVICNFKYANMYLEFPPVLIANTPEEARDQMLFLLNNPVEGQKIGEKARKWIMEYFDTRIVAKKLLDVYSRHLMQKT